jgi:alkylation response protein AidB-like acyl-CoA dehydrogenase
MLAGAGQVNTAKLLTADASWEALNTAARTFGGYWLDAEYVAKREFRETRLHRVTPISTPPIFSYLTGHVVSLSRSV